MKGREVRVLGWGSVWARGVDGLAEEMMFSAVPFPMVAAEVVVAVLVVVVLVVCCCCCCCCCWLELESRGVGALGVFVGGEGAGRLGLGGDIGAECEGMVSCL